jgi:hypothetical protein
MLGYTVRVPRSDNRLLNALKWDERVDPVMWQKVPTLFERAVLAGVSVTHVAAKRYEGSGFTQAALRGAKYVGANGVDEMATAVSAALKPQPSFVYTYLNTLDSAGHSDGVGSDKWLTALQQVSEFITKVKQLAPAGTRIWVTSDHGMVNSTEQVILGQDNKLLENVTLIGGEPRARHIYIKVGAALETITQWQEFFGNKARILSKDTAIKDGLFGPVVTEDSHDRLGDLIAIANNDLILVDPPYFISKDSGFTNYSDNIDSKLKSKYGKISIDFGEWDKGEIDWVSLFKEYLYEAQASFRLDSKISLNEGGNIFLMFFISIFFIISIFAFGKI